MSIRYAIGAALVKAGQALAPVQREQSPEPNPADRLLADPHAHIDQLFHAALHAETPESLIDFVEFCSRFRRYSIFNVRMIQTQRRGARVVATEEEWQSSGRHVLPDARPIIILRPFGPIMHVYEVEDTGPPIERDRIGDPFGAISEVPPASLAKLVEQLIRACTTNKQFHIEIKADRLGWNLAGSAAAQGDLPVPLPEDYAAAAHQMVESSPQPPVAAKSGQAAPGKSRMIPSWRVKLNDRLTPAQQLVTLAHELGHIFCGHQGACAGHGDVGGWPARRDLAHAEREMEAEAVASLIAQKAGIISQSAAYLRRHVASGDVRRVNTELVVRAAARIETLAGLRYGKR